MSNLSVENLSKILQTGDAEALMGMGGAGGLRAPGMSEARVTQEMQAQGMQVPSASGGDGAHSFSEMLRESVDKVNEYQHQADRATSELVAGRTKNVHETMLTLERADMSLKLMTQVRNKILDAYREIMRMQV